MCLSFNHQGGERSPVSLLQLSSAHSWSSCPLAHQRAARLTCKLHFLQPRLPPRMYRALLFAVLVLVLEPRFTQSSCQDEETHRAVSDEDPSFRLSSRNFPKRYNDIDYDSFVGLMGRRNADADDVPSPRKRKCTPVLSSHFLSALFSLRYPAVPTSSASYRRNARHLRGADGAAEQRC
uniref:Tachykinin precursor 3a n=1 Tax=Astyanax mexicanus TaxID=7994 RepID=A0A8B9H4D3_ASTMX